MPSVNIESLEDYRRIVQVARDCPLVVCFYVNWSFQCQQILPTFEKFSDNIKDYGWLKFYKVDCEDQPEIATLYPGGPADLLPAFVIYKNGEKVGEEFGSHSWGLPNLLNKHSARAQMTHRPPISTHYNPNLFPRRS